MTTNARKPTIDEDLEPAGYYLVMAAIELHKETPDIKELKYLLSHAMMGLYNVEDRDPMWWVEGKAARDDGVPRYESRTIWGPPLSDQFPGIDGYPSFRQAAEKFYRVYGHEPWVCECGHTEGEHRVWTKAATEERKSGPCYMEGCTCPGYVKRPKTEAEEQAEATTLERLRKLTDDSIQPPEVS